MQRPIIGISSRKIYFTHNDRPYPRFGVAVDYVQAVEAAGGAPLILPLTQSADVLERIMSMCDGLLLTGGFDVGPQYYGEEPHEKIGQINPLRDATEMTLASGALAEDMPIFAICRGIQILNVVTGGTLYQDLSSQYSTPVLQHFQQLTEEYPSHSMDIAPGSWLHRMTGDEKVRINSYHHQAVKDLGEGLVVTGVAPDGVIEAVESEQHTWVKGVQWHPELAYKSFDFNLAMFRSHVEAAGQFACRRAEIQVD